MRPFTCISNFSCDVCHLSIAFGDNMQPTLGKPLETNMQPTLGKPLETNMKHRSGSVDKGRLRWAHAECAPHAPSLRDDRPACKHFARSSCALGDNCWFSHGTQTLTPRRRTGSGGRRIVRNDGKITVFRSLIVRLFGDRLKRGTGVLDVAGGKGELAFELLNLNAVPCTVVDPRPLQCGAFVDSYNAGLYHWNPHINRMVTTEWNRAPELPKHVRMWLNADVLESLHAERTVTDAEVRKPWATIFSRHANEAERTVWTRKGLEYHEDIPDDLKDEPADCPEEACRGSDLQGASDPAGCAHLADVSEVATPLTCPEEVRRLFENCSCVVGMHPDSAAEPIVDHALMRGVPFALVPCCVYAKLFPKRKLRNGKSVSTHEDLLTYLMEKNTNIRREQLPFEGKNTVLYWDPIA